MKVICINDKGRPSVIPISKWIKKDEEYNVIYFLKCNVQGGIYGYKLAEIELGPESEPYKCFAANRFAIAEKPLEIEETEEELITA